MKLLGFSRSVMAFALVVSVSAPALAGGKFTLFGDASKVPGPVKKSTAVQLDSDEFGDFGYSGIAFEPTRTKKKFLRLRDVKTLAATYQIQAGGFAGGSARFSLGLDEDHDGVQDSSLHVYLGEYPNFDDEVGALTLTGNLIKDDTLRFDSSQLADETGSFYGSWDEALELAGDAEVLYVILVVDSYWAVEDGFQSVLITSMQVNSDKLNPKTVKIRNDEEN